MIKGKTLLVDFNGVPKSEIERTLSALNGTKVYERRYNCENGKSSFFKIMETPCFSDIYEFILKMSEGTNIFKVRVSEKSWTVLFYDGEDYRVFKIK